MFAQVLIIWSVLGHKLLKILVLVLFQYHDNQADDK